MEKVNVNLLEVLILQSNLETFFKCRAKFMNRFYTFKLSLDLGF
jgi:hypothetical protein